MLGRVETVTTGLLRPLASGEPLRTAPRGAVEDEDVAMQGQLAGAADPATRVTSPATVLVADDRPLVRRGLVGLVATCADVRVVGSCTPAEVVQAVLRTEPGVLLLATRETDADPFRSVAAAKRVAPALRVLVIADTSSVLELREAVVAGVDSFLLSTAGERDVVDAVVATARGERAVSPQVAMQLAGSGSVTGDDAAVALTPRELEVLRLLSEGLTNQQIGAALEVSPRTVKTHVQHLLEKLGTADRTGAVARGFRLGLIR